MEPKYERAPGEKGSLASPLNPCLRLYGGVCLAWKKLEISLPENQAHFLKILDRHGAVVIDDFRKIVIDEISRNSFGRQSCFVLTALVSAKQ